MKNPTYMSPRPGALGRAFLQKQMICYLDTNMVTINKVATEIGIPWLTLNSFVNGTKQSHPLTLLKIQKFLQKRGIIDGE